MSDDKPDIDSIEIFFLASTPDRTTLSKKGLDSMLEFIEDTRQLQARVEVLEAQLEAKSARIVEIKNENEDDQYHLGVEEAESEGALQLKIRDLRARVAELEYLGKSDAVTLAEVREWMGVEVGKPVLTAVIAASRDKARVAELEGERDRANTMCDKAESRIAELVVWVGTPVPTVIQCKREVAAILSYRRKSTDQSGDGGSDA